jgi:diacylglycerol kinase family enzyme
MAATHLLVGNPTAQSGRNAERIDRARQWLADNGIQCDLLPTLPDGATVPAVRQAIDAGTYRVVISMGGDGTFREVAEGLLDSARREEVALGMLPTGTANDQGKSFGLEATPEALEANARVVAAGREVQLDAGRIEAVGRDGHVTRSAFFDSAGWGISARVLRVRNEDRRFVASVPPLGELYRDHLVYAGAALKVFLESYVVPDKFDAEIESNGATRTLTGLTDLIVKNTRYYGGIWVFDRTARPDDGLFEVVPFQGKRDWTSKAVVGIDGNPLTEEALNEIGIEHSRSFRISKATLRFAVPSEGVPFAAQIDGEEFPAAETVRIEVLPRALRLIVPTEWEP